jgi:ribonuclease HI
MNLEEARGRLEAIQEAIQTTLDSGTPMLTSTYDFLHMLLDITQPESAWKISSYQPPISKNKDLKPNHIILSCDASITKNPGGEVAVGVVVEWPKNSPNTKTGYSQRTRSTTNNQGEYDAIYIGISNLMNLHNNPGCELEVRSDSKLVIDQLTGKSKCNDPELQRRRDLILELIASLPVPVRFVWRPRNSTPALTEANYRAQDALGVSRH